MLAVNDVTANGGINMEDVVLTRNQRGKMLPAGEPSLPAAAMAALVIARAGSPPAATAGRSGSRQSRP